MSDETVTIRFLIDSNTRKKRLKWKDLKVIQKAQNGEGLDLEKIQVIASRFMVDESNQYLPFEQAYATFDELTQEDAEDALRQFTTGIAEAALPNGNGRTSEPTSTASSPMPPPSPDGVATS